MPNREQKVLDYRAYRSGSQGRVSDDHHRSTVKKSDGALLCGSKEVSADTGLDTQGVTIADRPRSHLVTPFIGKEDVLPPLVIGGFSFDLFKAKEQSFLFWPSSVPISLISHALIVYNMTSVISVDGGNHEFHLC